MERNLQLTSDSFRQLFSLDLGHKPTISQNFESPTGTHTHVFPNDVYLSQQVAVAGCAHQIGTLRLGKDFKTSVLDVNCKIYGIDNLYVVDGSFFPSIAAINLTLTIIANALRRADHLK